MLHEGSSLVIIVKLCGLCGEEHLGQRWDYIQSDRELRNLKRLPQAGIFILLTSRVTHVASLLRLRKASCLLKKGRGASEGTFEKVPGCCSKCLRGYRATTFLCRERCVANFPKE